MQIGSDGLFKFLDIYLMNRSGIALHDCIIDKNIKSSGFASDFLEKTFYLTEYAYITYRFTDIAY